MPLDVITSKPLSNNPFEIARRKLITMLAAVQAPDPIGVGNPEPRDFELVRDHIAEVAAIADIWLRAIGDELRCNTTLNLNKQSFEGAFTGAVDGWATFECDRCADHCEEEAA